MTVDQQDLAKLISLKPGALKAVGELRMRLRQLKEADKECKGRWEEASRAAREDPTDGEVNHRRAWLFLRNEFAHDIKEVEDGLQNLLDQHSESSK